MERRSDTIDGEDGTPRTHDLTRIEGIGPKIASRLTASGVLTCADLAERPVDELIKLLPDITGLSPAKVERWRVRARELATATEPPTDNRPYESFLVRVLLDESGVIRSTTVQHVRSGEQARWAAWERESLLDFIEGRVAPSPIRPVSVNSPASQGTSRPDVRADTPADLTTGLTLDLVDRQHVRADGRLAMTITLDLDAAELRADRLAYNAVVVARKLGTKTRYQLASGEGLVPVREPTIRLEGQGLPAGFYRLEAAVSLREPGAVQPGGLAATAEGLALEVPAS
ncbi:helix-hairpin-helix domain-containing protein [Streptomyces sp. SID13726]|uniref:helix-hairpin-helix domain-containing protein n=1 Tax=Streptomyces sp. SID13726 TaxID=2706058 RepID=UPI0013BBFCFF|nr:helix-hairpin-helix domain-containing protein [Streptomyces sp. SID13726]